MGRPVKPPAFNQIKELHCWIRVTWSG